jgi:hypothetical protein
MTIIGYQIYASPDALADMAATETSPAQELERNGIQAVQSTHWPIVMARSTRFEPVSMVIGIVLFLGGSLSAKIADRVSEEIVDKMIIPALRRVMRRHEEPSASTPVVHTELPVHVTIAILDAEDRGLAVVSDIRSDDELISIAKALRDSRTDLGFHGVTLLSIDSQGNVETVSNSMKLRIGTKPRPGSPDIANGETSSPKEQGSIVDTEPTEGDSNESRLT